MSERLPEPTPNDPFALYDSHVRRVGPERVIAELRPFISDARAERIEAVLQQRLTSVQVAIERPQDPHNAAAIVRTAEALGCTDVHVVAAEPGALNIKGTTQGAFHWIDTHHWDDLDGLARGLPSPPVRVYGAVMGGEYTPETLPVDGPVCVLLGNETHGLSPEALEQCHGSVRIEMFGMSESLNLSVSAGILLHRLCARRREAIAAIGDMAPERLAYQRARAYARSVDARQLAATFTE